MTDLHALLDTHQLSRLLRISFPGKDGPPRTVQLTPVASTLGLPGSLPRAGTEVAPAMMKSFVI